MASITQCLEPCGYEHQSSPYCYKQSRLRMSVRENHSEARHLLVIEE